MPIRLDSEVNLKKMNINYFLENKKKKKIEKMNLFDLSLNVQYLIIKQLDFESQINLSLTCKEGLKTIENSLGRMCRKHPYWIYFESCHLNKEILNRNWRNIKSALDDFYDRWYTRAFKRTPKNFIFCKEIGEGSFSVVWEVIEKNHSARFAIKQVAKQQLLREKKLEAIKREKDVKKKKKLFSFPF